LTKISIILNLKEMHAATVSSVFRKDCMNLIKELRSFNEEDVSWKLLSYIDSSLAKFSKPYSKTSFKL